MHSIQVPRPTVEVSHWVGEPDYITANILLVIIIIIITKSLKTYLKDKDIGDPLVVAVNSFASSPLLLFSATLLVFRLQEQL